MAADTEDRVGIVVYVRDEASGPLNRIHGSFSRFNTLSGKIGYDLEMGVRRGLTNLERMGVAAAVAVGGAGVAALKWAADFESGMNKIATIIGQAPLQQVADGIKQLSATGGADLADLQQAFYDVVSVGFDAEQGMAILNKAFYLGRAGIGTTSEAVDVLTKAINSYRGTALYAGKTTDELASLFSDQLAQAVKDGGLTLSNIAETFANTAAIAASAAVGVDQISAAYAFLTSQGITAGQVTTELNRSIIELQKPNKNLLDLQKEMGKDYSAIVAQKGLVATLQEMRVDAAKTGVEFEKLFGRQEAYRFALQTTTDDLSRANNNFAQYQQQLEEVGRAQGTAAAQAAERAKGFQYNFDILKRNVEIAGIAIGNAMIVPLTKASQSLTSFIQRHQNEINQFADRVGAGLTSAVQWLDEHLESIGGIISSFANIGAGIAKGFLDLPEWVQQVLIGMFAVNKFTGGMVVDIGVDLARFKLFDRGTMLNPMYVRNVDGPGAGGATGATIGWLGKLSLAIEALLLSKAFFDKSAEIAAENKPLAEQVTRTTKDWLAQTPSTQDLENSLEITTKKMLELSGTPFFAASYALNLSGMRDAFDELKNTAELISKELQRRQSPGFAEPLTGKNMMATVAQETGAGVVGSAAAKLVALTLDSAFSDLRGWTFGMTGEMQREMHRAASIAKYGGKGLGEAAVDDTWARGQVDRAQKIIDANWSMNEKLSGLMILQQTLLDNGTAADKKAAAKIQELIDAYKGTSGSAFQQSLAEDRANRRAVLDGQTNLLDKKDTTTVDGLLPTLEKMNSYLANLPDNIAKKMPQPTIVFPLVPANTTYNGDSNGTYTVPHQAII